MGEDFLRPEAERLLEEIDDPQTSHDRRDEVGARLAKTGDPRPGVLVDRAGVVRIEWCPVRGGTVTLKDNAGEFSAGDFKIAKFPVTYAQFKASSTPQMGIA